MGGQSAPALQLDESGHVEVSGRSTPFLIRHLPVSSFPQLPAAVQSVLNQRGCVIPQTYEAHAPENVVAASLARRGSADWAVLCSEHGMVSLLVFFAGGAAQPTVLASAPETERLSVHGADGVLGFDWGVHTLLTRPARTSHAGLSAADRLRLGISEGLLRLSVGIEATEDLLEDFAQALG